MKVNDIASFLENNARRALCLAAAQLLPVCAEATESYINFMM